MVRNRPRPSPSRRDGRPPGDTRRHHPRPSRERRSSRKLPCARWVTPCTSDLANPGSRPTTGADIPRRRGSSFFFRGRELVVSRSRPSPCAILCPSPVSSNGSSAARRRISRRSADQLGGTGAPGGSVNPADFHRGTPSTRLHAVRWSLLNAHLQAVLAGDTALKLGNEDGLAPSRWRVSDL